MDFLKKILKQPVNKNNPAQRIRITPDNLLLWGNFEKLFKEGKIKVDSNGRLRYPHGAPVGEMILIRINKDGTSVYKESAEEWFDPGSQMAKDFVWP
jgi:hypothetical protein